MRKTIHLKCLSKSKGYNKYKFVFNILMRPFFPNPLSTEQVAEGLGILSPLISCDKTNNPKPNHNPAQAVVIRKGGAAA